MNRIQLNKKGRISLGEAGTLVIVLMTVGIVLTVGLLVLAEIQDTGLTALSGSVNNESEMSVSDATFIPFDDAAGRRDFSASITNITNGTTVTDSVVMLPTTNYTAVATGITLIAPAATAFPNLNLTYTYSHSQQDYFFNASIGSEEGLDSISSFQSIFGIIVAAVIVLGLIALFR